MLGTNDEFGMYNVATPQLFPTLRYSLNARQTLSTYLKFAPIITGLGLRSADNREIATGLGWSYLLSGNKALTVNSDFSSLRLIIRDRTGSMTSASLSVGVSF
jgi:hypothetical protein